MKRQTALRPTRTLAIHRNAAIVALRLAHADAGLNECELNDSSIRINHFALQCKTRDSDSRKPTSLTYRQICRTFSGRSRVIDRSGRAMVRSRNCRHAYIYFDIEVVINPLMGRLMQPKINQEKQPHGLLTTCE